MAAVALDTPLPLLPTEILTHIFTLSTTLDSGVTLRSLLRVSHLFHDICVPLKFSCVTLTTRLELKRFYQELQLLADAPTHLCRILHLYISLTLSDIQGDEECDTINQIFSILHTAADSLQSLAFIYQNTLFSASVFGRLFRQSFPVITELTIHGFYPFPSPIPSNEFITSDLSSELPLSSSGTSFMPRLERLHLSGNRNPYGLFQLSSLDKCFPSLIHLRISGLLMAGSFAEEVKVVLEEHSACYSSKDDEHLKERSAVLTRPVVRLPNNLQSLILQPGVSSISNSIALKKHSWMMAKLKEIDEAAKRRQGVRVTLRDCVQDSAIGNVSTGLHDDWLGRLNGTEGCW